METKSSRNDFPIHNILPKYNLQSHFHLPIIHQKGIVEKVTSCDRINSRSDGSYAINQDPFFWPMKQLESSWTSSLAFSRWPTFYCHPRSMLGLASCCRNGPHTLKFLLQGHKLFLWPFFYYQGKWERLCGIHFVSLVQTVKCDGASVLGRLSAEWRQIFLSWWVFENASG